MEIETEALPDVKDRRKEEALGTQRQEYLKLDSRKGAKKRKKKSRKRRGRIRNAALTKAFHFAYANRSRLSPGSPAAKELMKLMEQIGLGDVGFDERGQEMLEENQSTQCNNVAGSDKVVGKQEKSFSAGCKHMRKINDMEESKRDEPYISCQTIFGDKEMVVAAFSLPKGISMPIHDHPGMTVFSKLLVGKVICREYDWIDKARGASQMFREVLDAKSAGIRVIGPNLCNIHTFEAITDSVIVDIITPPYDPGTRNPNFYDPQKLKGDIYHMKKCMPKEFRCFEEPYRGPKLENPPDRTTV